MCVHSVGLSIFGSRQLHNVTMPKFISSTSKLFAFQLIKCLLVLSLPLPFHFIRSLLRSVSILWLTVRAMRNFRFPSSLCVYTVHATRIILAFACGHVFRMSAIYEPIKAILFLSEIIPFKFKCFSLSSWVIFSIFFVCFCSTIRMHIFLVNS